MKRLETQASGGVIETVAKYTGAALGVLAGLDVAAAAETVLGKVLTVAAGGVAGAYIGKSVGRAAA